MLFGSQVGATIPKMFVPNNSLLTSQYYRWEWILIDDGDDALARHIRAMDRFLADDEMGPLLTDILYAARSGSGDLGGYP